MAEGVKHFLYLLPDAAYAVELVPNKEGTGHVIRDYLQVNGEFMDENVILPESMEKLAGKLQPQTYELILPDFLFTNTVVNVEKTGEEEVKKYVDAELVPSLELSADTHEIQSFILTEHKGSAKVQLSAFERSLLDPIRAAFSEDAGPRIKNIYPLSWTLKSLISLEPSISIVQMGGYLYLAQHYIGVDQANTASAEDAEKLIETVKTLKGAEPSIQTLYLLSSALVEKALREGLKATVPLQQLADDSQESEMPSYIQQAVEAGAKTLSVADYKVPSFIMDAGAPKAVSAVPAAAHKEPMKKPSSLPADDSAKESLPAPTEADSGTEKETSSEPELKFADVPEPAEQAVAEPEAVDLAQFTSHEETAAEPAEKTAPAAKEAAKTEPKEPMTEKPAETSVPKKPVIKNESGVNNMVRMIVIGLISFFVTVGIGLGIGLGLLTFTKPADTQQTAEPTPTAETTPEPTPTPTPTPEVDRAEYDVLVVNATTKAGYAGEVAETLEAAGFEDVAAQNAVGDYETGNYVLLDEEDQALISLLSEDSGLDLEFADGKEVEDASGDYTVVIVLAE